ncbi:MAG: hypothetical protein AAB473_00170 [Patescibacteria group bacterium]
MHILLVSGSADSERFVRRMLGADTTHTISVLGTAQTLQEIEAALKATPTMDLAPYGAIVLIGVHGNAHRTIYAVARELVERPYSGRLIAIARRDETGSPSEERKNFRSVGIRDDQFAPTIEAAIRALNS